jgi:cardiolipin synthase (CMP-forming)
VLTIPNVISLVRLACVPLFLWLVWGADEPVAAAWLLAFCGATDWVDGYIARHFAQGSELGKILDPAADRALLIAGAVVLLTEDVPGAVKVIVVIVLVREVLVGAVTIALAIAGARRIDVIWAGKAGTFAIMFALPMFLLAAHVDGAWYWVLQVGAWGCAIGGLALGWYAAARYVPAAREAVAEGRAARAARAQARPAA